MGRQDVEFLSGGTRCAAWLYRPEQEPDLAISVPVIVMAHGLGGTRTMRLDAFAERFAAAGYACLVFDYRHFGDSGGEPRQLLSVREQVADWEAAIAHARTLEGVDPDRVVVWGTSFGGGHALTMAARDPRLAAAIAQCPFTDGIASALAVDTVTSARVTVAALRDKIRGLRGREPIYLPNAAAPGTPAFMTSPDALPGLMALGATASDNRLTARSALDVLRYAPGRRTRRIAVPLFVALCGPDTVAPSRTAERQVRRAPRAEVRTYPVGHFEIYVGDAFERAVADYVEFLGRHVPGG
ncbi:alpha/beta hydrolase [Nocardioides sp. Root190]|uniref:alpha/beta hydrolase n=1 Tax=Nocardioides sp. Root190 TaxID=1736488 RepID=UPI0006FF0139|nr:alpha/beta hydrolase [Nocardioides sp. Root190]KRB78488.1 alpha/beta hydrolase [Nocardioides sp. Root190]